MAVSSKSPLAFCPICADSQQYPAAALMEAIEGTDIKLDAVKDTIDVGTFGILAAVGKIELDSIRQRVSMGIRGRAKRGKAPSHIRFGYKKDHDGYPIINPPEAEIVRRIYRMYAGGHSRTEIADALNHDGISTPRGRSGPNPILRNTSDTQTMEGQGVSGANAGCPKMLAISGHAASPTILERTG